MNKKLAWTVLLVMFSFGVTCCSKESNKGENTAEYIVYFVNNLDTKLVEVPYTTQTAGVEKVINELVEELKSTPSNIGYKSTIPETVSKPSVEYSADSGEVTLKFDSTYNELKGIQELLRRAAIVKTLCQVKGVNDVVFYVAEQPLTDTDGTIGAMEPNDFIDSNSYDYMKEKEMVLYFSDKSGKQLVKKYVEVQYDGITSLEEVIVNYLINVSDYIEQDEDGALSDIKQTIPSGTICNRVSVTDGLCVVDFNSKFLKKEDDISEEVVIYSIVNSLTELASVNKVQFTINGKSVKVYQKFSDFDQVYESDLDIVKE